MCFPTSQNLFDDEHFSTDTAIHRHPYQRNRWQCFPSTGRIIESFGKFVRMFPPALNRKNKKGKKKTRQGNKFDFKEKKFRLDKNLFAIFPFFSHWSKAKESHRISDEMRFAIKTRNGPETRGAGWRVGRLKGRNKCTHCAELVD